jgi:hypothetical protein
MGASDRQTAKIDASTVDIIALIISLGQFFMKVGEYLVRMPWTIDPFKWGLVVMLRRPIVKARSRPVRSDDDGSISIWLTLLDDES